MTSIHAGARPLADFPDTVGRMWVESEFGVGTTFHFVVRFGLATRPVDAVGDGVTPARCSG